MLSVYIYNIIYTVYVYTVMQHVIMHMHVVIASYNYRVATCRQLLVLMIVTNKLL